MGGDGGHGGNSNDDANANAAAVERARAAALRLEYCTARFLCKKEARAYKEAVAFLDVASEAGNGYWASIAVDRKLSDMRAALARFTQRQAEARGGGRRGGGGGGGGGEGEDGH